MIKRWQTQNSKKVFTCRWFEVSKNKVKLPDNKLIDYYKVETPPSVIIIALTADSKLVMTKQYRYPIDEFSWELPSGRTDGKSSIAAARAELEEETGFKASNIRKIGEFIPWNGVGDEVCHVYLATKLEKTEQKLDEAEFIDACEMRIKDVLKMAIENKIRDGMTLAALSLAGRYLKKYL